MPVSRNGRLASLLILGRASAEDPDLSQVSLEPYINLMSLMTTCLEKIQTQKEVQRRLAEFHSLWHFSQAISLETDLGPLYQAIHEQVEKVMGQLSSFAVALYDRDSDAIHIPYMIEDGTAVRVDPFPIGEGLTTVVIRTRRPLMLVEDTAERARQLGAVMVGAPAKSWLGVPMMAGGEVVGVIIAQDIHREHRFDENDQRLLSTLASQAAVVVRNARLVESSQGLAERERIKNDIVSKIRQSTDIQTILKITADELGSALGARRAHIKIEVDT
jgi:GAF domain-containing protein